MDCVNSKKWLDITFLKYYSQLEVIIVHFVIWQGTRGKILLWLNSSCHVLFRIWVAGKIVWLKYGCSELKNNYPFYNVIKTPLAVSFCCHGLIISFKHYWLKLHFWVCYGDKHSGDVTGSSVCVRSVNLDIDVLYTKNENADIFQIFWVVFKYQTLVPEKSPGVLQLSNKLSIFWWYLVTKFRLMGP